MLDFLLEEPVWAFVILLIICLPLLVFFVWLFRSLFISLSPKAPRRVLIKRGGRNHFTSGRPLGFDYQTTFLAVSCGLSLIIIDIGTDAVGGDAFLKIALLLASVFSFFLFARLLCRSKARHKTVLAFGKTFFTPAFAIYIWPKTFDALEGTIENGLRAIIERF
ncbi:MAG: hypothetical protein AB7U75_17190 [Hyphomicrobiaceae bacterium]